MVFLGHLLTTLVKAVVLGAVAVVGVKLGISLRMKKNQDVKS